MIVETRTLSHDELERLISNDIHNKMSDKDLAIFRRFVDMTTVIWAGFYRDQVKAVWGLIPPALALDSAYLWLHVFEHVADCEFMFVRHSQKAIKEALLRYPNIMGHCLASDNRAQRWLKWLGAEFEVTQASAVPFMIKAKHEPAIAS